MYKINRQTNNIIKLEEKLFSELKFREREHLQEWIAKNPEVLSADENDELLIIQKEFDGFDGTNERLDLLALDKEGRLVIIENKLDDTGKDVVWQALKYTSYCSNLSTNEIISIYQDYLNKEGTGEKAKENLLEFFNNEDDELLLNPKDKDQRIIFVANKFRKEVTSTVMWLLDHNINIQCFRATPYEMNGEEFLQIDQIIPVPEVKDFLIQARQKEKEEQEKSKRVLEKEAALIELWSMVKRKLKEKNMDYLERVSVKPYFDIGFLKGEGRFNFNIGRNHYRVELYFRNDETKKYYDAIIKYKTDIEKSLGKKIIGERLNGKKASRIKHEMPKELHSQIRGNWHDTEIMEKLSDWYVESYDPFIKAIYPILEKVEKSLKI